MCSVRLTSSTSTRIRHISSRFRGVTSWRSFDPCRIYFGSEAIRSGRVERNCGAACAEEEDVCGDDDERRPNSSCTVLAMHRPLGRAATCVLTRPLYRRPKWCMELGMAVQQVDRYRRKFAVFLVLISLGCAETRLIPTNSGAYRMCQLSSSPPHLVLGVPHLFWKTSR